MVAIILSIIFPGLGQFYYGKNVHGIIMLIMGVTPLYPIALIWSVIDVIRLNKQGLTPKYDSKEAIRAIVLCLVIIPACFVVLLFGSASLLAWYQRAYGWERATREEGKRIVSALEKYRDDLGDYPSELTALIDGRPIRSDWSTDEWGLPYYYQVSSNGEGFTLISKGKDHTLGTEDDIIFQK